MAAYESKYLPVAIRILGALGWLSYFFGSGIALAQDDNVTFVDGYFAHLGMEADLADPYAIPAERYTQSENQKSSVTVSPNAVRSDDSKITVADIVQFDGLTSGDLVSSITSGKIKTPVSNPPVIASEPNSGEGIGESILVAVEKKHASGRVSRKEALLVLDEPDNETSSRSDSGIAISLGLDRPLVQVLLSSVGISVQPAKIFLPGKGSSVEIRIDDFTGGSGAPSSVKVYPRNPALLNWDETNKILTASVGDTSSEVFIARDGQLVVVPVTIGQPVPVAQNRNRDQSGRLPFPAEIAQLPDTVKESNARFAANGVPGSVRSEDSASKTRTGSMQSHSPDQMYLGASAEDVDGKRLSRHAQFAARTSFELQLIDDRSPARDRKVKFPVTGVRVYAAGTEFSTASDGHGKALISEVPSNSSMVVVTEDPSGNYVKTTTVVDAAGAGSTDTGGPGIVKRDLVVPRWSAFNAWARMSGNVQDAALGSLCLDFYGLSASGIRATVDVKSSKAVYLNTDGLPDPAAKASSEGGRVCWFNVSPGPVNVSAWYGDRQIMAAEFPVTTGRHTHERVAVLSEPVGLHVQFGREAPVHEQLSDGKLASNYSVDASQEAVLVATTQTLFESGPGIWGVGSLTRSTGGSMVVYVDTPDGEPTIHRAGALGSVSSVQVLPSLPRGFVQDLAVYANEVQDFSYGSVLVEFSSLQGQSSDRLTARLVNEFGQQVSEPWVFSDLPVAKGIFFNVDPGVYTLVLESPESGWLSSKTVSVYPEATSVVQAGSPLKQFVPAQAHH